MTGESIKEIRNETVKRSQSINNLRSLREGADKGREVINRLENALPRRESLFLFSEEMNRLARENGLTFSFSFREEIISESPASPNKANFTMNVTGELRSILVFINTIEESKYFTNITGFDLISISPLYQANLSGKLFFSK